MIESSHPELPLRFTPQILQQVTDALRFRSLRPQRAGNPSQCRSKKILSTS